MTQKYDHRYNAQAVKLAHEISGVRNITETQPFRERRHPDMHACRDLP